MTPVSQRRSLTRRSGPRSLARPTWCPISRRTVVDLWWSSRRWKPATRRRPCGPHPVRPDVSPAPRRLSGGGGRDRSSPFGADDHPHIAPSGPVLHLSGRPEAGREGVWLGDGPDGLGSVEVTALFEAAARQMGETYVGETMDHGELDLPIHILADSPDEFRRKKVWVSNLFERRRPGWLMSYTPAEGWHWLQVRKLSFEPEYGTDPGPKRGATFDLLLAAESPLAREADDTSEWINTSRSGKGQLHLFPGDGEWPAWPQFILRGPGTFRLRWAGNDVTFPPLNS